MDIVKGWNDIGVGFNFTFSNYYISESETKDKYCNYILEHAQNGINGVVLASEILNRHIKKNYPKIKRIYSVTNDLRRVEDYNKYTKLYDLVVLAADFNKDKEFLEGIEDKDRIEIMTNDCCIRNCPNRRRHYSQIALYNMKITEDPVFMTKEETDFTCVWRGTKEKAQGLNVLGSDDVERLSDIGFNRFKLVGRDLPSMKYMENLVKYIYNGTQEKREEL